MSRQIPDPPEAYNRTDQQFAYSVIDQRIGDLERALNASTYTVSNVTPTRTLDVATATLPDALSPGVRPGMRLARTIYSGVLDRVEAIGFDVLRGSAGLAPWRIGPAAFRTLTGLAR